MHNIMANDMAAVNGGDKDTRSVTIFSACKVVPYFEGVVERLNKFLQVFAALLNISPKFNTCPT